MSDDVSFLATLITDYLEDATQHLETMRRAVDQGNALLLERTAHTLKSTSETMGAVALAASSREIETLAHEGRLDEAAQHVPEAVEQFASVRVELRNQQVALNEE